VFLIIFADARPERSAYNTEKMRYLIVLLALAGLVDSVLALRIHNQDPSQAPPCAVTEKFDCGAVNHSRFAVFPAESFDEQPGAKKFHIPVATLGIIGYGLIALAALADWTWVTLQLAEIGFFGAAMLSYLEAFVIQKWCIYCVWSQGIITAILLCSIAAAILKHRRAKFRHSAVLAS
jgi:vitamin-K-epoxide reductase (warfarin-sensitive)